MKKLHFYLFPIICVLFFASCEDPDSSPRALLNLILVDSPAKWDSVFVEIEGVDIEVLAEGRETQSQTFFLEYKSGDKRIKISDLVGGNALLLGRSELPIGQVINATIILGDNHSMFLNEKKFVLELSDPSEDQISLSTSIDIEQGTSYDILLDLDLEKSIVQVSESPLTYELDPTFTLIKGADTGEISGVIKPVSLYPALILTGENESYTTHTDASGRYTFRVPAGSYELYIDAKDDLYEDYTLTINLVERMDTVLTEITLLKKP
ncbi:DUF4382 domain-containing protein [Algoriphagus sp. D3-2-R+10]|uniref:DUF4382 domain-containing protein n=1 Tax=Algoriphagus aurantiacus TaxID=3103948 RepID=UPI002B39C120|nr:DUF4382 domain-containing protein [Algoriphagus sp. D3-2-R+10]MEB2773962.1 DUF4382 domain-containing protein [Algoriphagus sp. D3-2-R+10]